MIRSGIIVDTSFLPRFILLNLVLLFTFLVRFRKMQSAFISWFDLFFAAFYLWNIAGMVWAIAPSETLEQSQLIFTAFALYLITRSLSREFPSFLRSFITVLIPLLLLSYSLAFIKIFSLDFFDPYQIISVSANNNLFSGFLLITLPFLLIGYSLFRNILRFLFVGCGVISVFLIIIVQSRAVYLGLFISFLILMMMLVTRFRNLLNRKNLVTGFSALVVLTAGLVLFYLSLDQPRRNYFMSKIPVWNYFHSYEGIQAEKSRRQLKATENQSMPEFDFAAEYYENANLRLIFWKKSAGLITSRPVTGVAAGNWRLAVPSVAKPPNPDHTLRNYTYSQPHNEWICFLAETGIPGLLLALVVFLALPLMVWFLPNKNFLAILLASFMLGFYVFACFDFPFHRIEHLVMISCALGFLSGISPVKPALPLKISRLVPFICIPLLVLSLIMGIYRFRGEYFTLKMFQFERKDDVTTAAYARKAENCFYHITPNALPVSWFRGVALYRTGDTTGAVREFEKALVFTPWEVRVLNDYGTSLYNSGKQAEGKAALLKCFRTDPFFDDAKLNLSFVYLMSGRRDSSYYFLTLCRPSAKKDRLLEMLMHQ
ncbi:MAG: O-antigen ligase family protein [Syntrophothermus sp.]